MKINNFTSTNIIEVLVEDWNQLKNALNKKNIKIFLNLVFKELTDKINNCKEIYNIQELIEIETELEKIIKNTLKKYDNYEKQYKILNQKLRSYDLDSTSALLNENYNYSLYNQELYPFYKYFLFTDYIFENNINNKLNFKNKKKEYMVLYKYINKKKI